MSSTKKYLGQWFDFDFNGTIRRAKCIDVEFESGMGPIFLMSTARGNTFWLTREEINYHESNGRK